MLRAVCAFLGLDFAPAMLQYWKRTPERLQQHHARYRIDGSVIVTREQRLAQQRLTMQPPQPERISRWRKDLTEHERSEFLHFAGDMLEELGYEV